MRGRPWRTFWGRYCMDIDPGILRVLVVDDQKAMRSIVIRLLKQMGITEFEEARNGDEALQKLRNPRIKDPDVIVTDLHMDGMDGLELCNTIRRDENMRSRHIPVVVLTGDEDELIHEVTMQLGAAEVLTKPVSAPELFEGIRKAIGYAVES